MTAIISTPIVSEQQWQEMRSRNIGCSEVAALCGVHPYVTGYGLAARKLGKLPQVADNPVMKRGRLLEPIAKQLLAEQVPEWKQIDAPTYFEDPSIRWGATPDLLVRDETRGIGIVQIKTVTPWDFANRWHNDDGLIEPPLWIAIQAMGEQHLTGADFAYVAALVVGHGLSLELVEVVYLPDFIDSLRARIVEFWKQVDAGRLPDPDFGVDHKVLAQVLREDDGSEIDLSDDNELPEIAARLQGLRDAEATAREGIKDAQARILHKIGGAKLVRFAGGTIKAPTVRRKEYTATVKASEYRTITVKMDRERMRA